MQKPGHAPHHNPDGEAVAAGSARRASSWVYRGRNVPGVAPLPSRAGVDDARQASSRRRHDSTRPPATRRPATPPRNDALGGGQSTARLEHATHDSRTVDITNTPAKLVGERLTGADRERRLPFDRYPTFHGDVHLPRIANLRGSNREARVLSHHDTTSRTRASRAANAALVGVGGSDLPERSRKLRRRDLPRAWDPETSVGFCRVRGVALIKTAGAGSAIARGHPRTWNRLESTYQNHSRPNRRLAPPSSTDRCPAQKRPTGDKRDCSRARPRARTLHRALHRRVLLDKVSRARRWCRARRRRSAWAPR